MAGTILWQSGAVIQYAPQLSGTGRALSGNAVIQMSGDFYNNGASGGPVFFIGAVLHLAASGYGAAVQSKQPINLTMIPSFDGTNFPNVDIPNASLVLTGFRGSFITTTSGNQQDIMFLEGIPVLPVRYRIYLQNFATQSMASGWGLDFYGYNEAYT